MYRPMIRLSAAKRPWGFQKSSVSLLKRCRGFTETHRPFSKSSASFSHRGRWNHPLTKPIIPSFRSSLHISQNTLSINRLTMTGYPFILLSVVLPKLLSNLPSVFICIKKSLTDERRLKRQHGMSIHYRNPLHHDVSAANERKNGIFGQLPD